MTSAARLDCACRSRRCTGRGNALHAPADCTSPVCQCSDEHCAKKKVHASRVSAGIRVKQAKS
ncbi:hypothetical protein XAPC_4259 [Xanthomonas citri pv. punicae str. LMG 859]|nr:hypothetical protein XAPC_4259 [Xanthomonas citri pv. punicae str. LMG 859]